MIRPLGVLRRLGANLGNGVRRAVARSVMPRRLAVWVVVRLGSPLDELQGPSLPFRQRSSQGLLDVLETLAAASRDPRVDGVLVRFEGAPQGWAKVLAVHRAVAGVRAEGKPVVAYGESLRFEDLVIGSAADRLWMPPSGALTAVGLRSEGFYLRGLLEQAGIEPEVLRVGSHKSAGEALTRDSMSDEQREQLGGVLDDLYGRLVEAVAEGRGLASDTVRERIDSGPYRGAAAVDAGLIDACLYPDEIEDALRQTSPSPRRPAPRRQGTEAGTSPLRFVDGATYHALRASDPGWRPLLRDHPRIAYVVASGGIRRGQGLRGVTSDSFRSLLESLQADPEVRGVVVRIDSPGGDSLASDLLYRALRIVSRDKPVVVSLGDVAASGGYYLAAAGDAVLAEAGTITGSIGVIGGKVNLSRLYERLGIGRDGVERGAHAGIASEARRLRPSERAALRADMQAVYGMFLDRVAEGRGLARDEVERCAEGRIFSGVRALGLGLVDAIGGPLEALGEARRRAGIDDRARVLVDVYPRLPRLPTLRSLVGLWLALRAR